MAYRHRPKALASLSDKENVAPLQKPQRLYAPSPQSTDRLSRPFKCPGSAIVRAREGPARKRRKISYADTDSSLEGGDRPWTNEERLALANRDANKFPIYKVKDKETLFRQRFSIPLSDKDSASFDPSRPAPTLGMRRGAVFIAKPLHDPGGEFAIVLFDPTVDDKPSLPDSKESITQEERPKVKVSLMHKSLAEILGIKKQVDTEQPKVPVVIDPRLTKVLRPHQVEGVKASGHWLDVLGSSLTYMQSFSISV